MLHPAPLQQHSEARTECQLAAIVDQGLQMAQREGVGAAIEFMSGKGIEAKIIYRVLGDPQFHRPI